ncbi:hypothetical protein BJ878DRAFT_533049 [Calycina marina]|uniref:Uncharacterized protein n=1 Tax=Calycina marina TaxID=1763456 RepID=A0A9P7Z891_9HELO|nr:hypothetical protein BJ878DRAFT_533049 [Calycina marina]
MPSATAVTAITSTLVVGESYGGLAFALNLLNLCAAMPARLLPDTLEKPAPSSRISIPIEIKIIGERDGYSLTYSSNLDHLIRSPLSFSSPNFLQGSVNNIDCERKVATGGFPDPSSALRQAYPYAAQVSAHIEKVKNARDEVVVIGGAELKLVQPSQKVIFIHSREELLSSEPLPTEFKERALATIRDIRVEVILNERVTSITPCDSSDGSQSSKLTFKDGRYITTGHVIWALSKCVATLSYLTVSSLDAANYVTVEPTLKFAKSNPNSKFHYAVGDIASWSGIRRCGGAMYMGFTGAINRTKLHRSLRVSGDVGSCYAVTYWPGDGVASGEDPMKWYFGDDLGFTKFHLGLSTFAGGEHNWL